MQILLVLLSLALILIASSIFRSARWKGARGEARVRSALKAVCGKRNCVVFDNVTLPTHDGTTQVDHIVISPFGIFVIETKNMSGWIYGDANNSTWTQVFYNYKTRFQNPLHQNYKHIKAVQAALKVNGRNLHNLVVFVGSSRPKTQMPANVIWGSKALAVYIRSKQDVVFQQDEIHRLAGKLSDVSIKPSLRTHLAHVRHVKTLRQQRRDPKACPRCGAVLVERLNTKAGKRFLGCTRFPQCRGARQFPDIKP